MTDSKPTKPSAAPAEPASVTKRVLRTVHGGRMLDPFTEVMYRPEPREEAPSSWVESQLAAGKLEAA